MNRTAKRYREKFPDRVKSALRHWRKNNVAKIRSAHRQWYLENRARLLAAKRAAYRSEEGRRRALAYRIANLEAIRARDRRNEAKHRVAKSNRAISQLLRSRMHKALKGADKSARTAELLGCTIEQLKLHLQAQFKPGMAWNNHGKIWHIDHRLPCAGFDLSKPDQQRKCFHYANLQPLWAIENLSKGPRPRPYIYDKTEG